MNYNPLRIVFALVVSLAISNVYAAGSPVNEDFSLVISLCDDMVTMAEKGDQEGFLKLADSTLKLSEALRRDNSMAIDRFRPKLRAAKKAGKSGDLNTAVLIVEEAKTFMKPTTAKWDGGS